MFDLQTFHVWALQLGQNNSKQYESMSNFERDIFLVLILSILVPILSLFFLYFKISMKTFP